MKIDLVGQRARLLGRHAVLDAVGAALRANGCAVEDAASDAADPLPDIVVVADNVLPAATPEGPEDMLDPLGQAMLRRGSGRIVVLVSAYAAVPSRRFPEDSVAAGARVLQVRTLAMRLGPAVLVNAVGCGPIADEHGALVSGDASMLSHVPTGQPGTIEDVVQAVLFLCDPMNSYMTGQMLAVDGGWSTGYGRNF